MKIWLEAEMIPQKLIMSIVALILCALPHDVHSPAAIHWQAETGG